MDSVTETKSAAQPQPETAYTPAPWRLEPNGTSAREDGYNLYGPHRQFLAHLPVIEETIRHGNDYQTLHHGEELEARARLIVAAPHLFAALKALRAWVDAIPRDTAFDYVAGIQFIEARNAADKAIAKAEGR